MTTQLRRLVEDTSVRDLLRNWSDTVSTLTSLATLDFFFDFVSFQQRSSQDTALEKRSRDEFTFITYGK